MTRKVSNGWHSLCGYDVYVEDGYVLRGVQGDGVNMKTTYPYRLCRKGGWDNACGISVSAFRSACRRGTVRMM